MRIIRWKPKEDITAYELARLSELFIPNIDTDRVLHRMPDIMKRHVEIVEYQDRRPWWQKLLCYGELTPLDAGQEE